MILTCQHHNGGTETLYLRPPQQPDHILSYLKIYQPNFFIKPITISTMKASKYCTYLLMHLHRVSCQAIDTYAVTNFGGFSYTSKLLDELESR